MNNKYPFFKYITGDSRIHKMNSKLKIIWFLLTLLGVLLVKDFISVILLFLLLSFFMINSKVNVIAYVSNLFLLWIIYFLSFIIAFLVTKNNLFSLMVIIKEIMIVMLLLILTFTTSLSEIAWGFECTFSKLRKVGIPVSKISLKIAMDIKFISTLFSQSRDIRKSMAYRGVPYKTSKLKVFNKMFVPVVSLSYNLSRRMAKAMKLRFYGSSKRRTNYHENKTTKFDKVLVALSMVMLYVIIWLGWC